MPSVELVRSPRYPFIFINSPLPARVIKDLDRATSYEVQNAEFTGAYRKMEWDGKEHLLGVSRNGGYFFPSGLLHVVRRVLGAHGYTIELQNRKVKPVPRIKYRWVSSKTPRDYQVTQIDEIKKHMNAPWGGCVLASPMGSGKTFVACRIIYETGVPALIFVHQKELKTQWERAIEEYLGENVHTVKVEMLQSAHKIRQHEKERVELLIVDECHHVPARTFWSAVVGINAYYRLGLSATPKRTDGADLKIIAGLGPVIAPVGFADLAINGFLVTPEMRMERALPSGKKPVSRKTPQAAYNEEYTREIVLNMNRNRQIVEHVKRLVADGKKVYVHVTRIKHGEILSNMTGYPFVHSASPDRDELVEEFKNGKLKCMISTLLGEGFDCPEIDAIVMASGGKSEVALIQRIGRALRPSKGKSRAIIVDFYDSGRWLRDHSENRIEAFKRYFGCR